MTRAVPALKQILTRVRRFLAKAKTAHGSSERLLYDILSHRKEHSHA
jgi:hypothetical protein